MSTAARSRTAASNEFPSRRLAACYLAFFLLIGAAMAVRLHGITPVYARLAAAFLRGHLDVATDLHDVAIVAGRGYYPLGPAPAVLVLPLVAIFGEDVPNTVLGTLSLAAAVPALLRLVRREVADPAQAWWWLLATVAGTPLLLLAFADNSYYAAHVLVIALLGWALVLALDGRYALGAGILVGVATATRFDAAGAVLPIAILYMGRGDRTSGGSRWTRPLLVLGGMAPFLLLLAAYNAARFGTPFESGYALQYLNYPWLAALRDQGLFSVRHLPENLYYLLVAGPVVAGGSRLPSGFPWVVPSEWGMGVIWTSAWLLLGLAARGRQAAIVALGAVAVLLPSLFYYGVGWIQFGYRYGLDALPFLLLLALWGARRVSVRPRTLLMLFVVAMVVNAWGDLWIMGMWGLPRANVG